MICLASKSLPFINHYNFLHVNIEKFVLLSGILVALQLETV